MEWEFFIGGYLKNTRYFRFFLLCFGSILEPAAEAEDKDTSEQPFLLFTFFFFITERFSAFFMFTKYIYLLSVFDVCLV